MKPILQEKKAFFLQIAFMVIFVLVLRHLLWGNPAIWNFYSSTLSAKDIGETGWREYDYIKEQKRFYSESDTDRTIDFLAVGSSQTAAIYREYARVHPEHLRIMSLAGAGPLELLLFRQRIAKLKPHTVLLYLSAFDIANTGFKPYLSNIRLAPSQGMELFKIYPVYRRYGIWSLDTLFKAIVYECFPEIKYGYIFDGYLNKLAGREKSIHSNLASQYAALRPVDAIALQSDLLNYLKPEIIPCNIELLNMFLQWCHKQNIRVVIVEGHIRQDAITQPIIDLNAVVMCRLRQFVEVFDNLMLVEHHQLYPFTNSQYTDLFHVTPQAGFLFSKSLFSLLLENNP